MSGPLVTVGMPVYRGQDMLPVTLECVRTQTYANLDVLISVDDSDQPSIDAARPFLSDPRFRMVMQPTRLGWRGNHDFTMRERRGAFYLYQQHDDQVSPDYVEALVAAAERWPQASICYAAMEVSGIRERTDRPKSTLGTPVERALLQMERLDPVVLRGLMRGSALDTTAGLLANEYEGFGSDLRFLTEMALAGDFRYVSGPTYYKRLHGKNLHLKWYDWSDARKRGAWIVLTAWMIEVIVPAGGSTEERWRLLSTVLERFLVSGSWLDRLRNRSRSLYKKERDRGSRLLLALINRVRNSDAVNAWLQEHTRFMFYDPDPRDLVERAALLDAVIDRLRQAGRFDPAVHLQTDWAGLRERAARQLGVTVQL